MTEGDKLCSTEKPCRQGFLSALLDITFRGSALARAGTAIVPGTRYQQLREERKKLGSVEPSSCEWGKATLTKIDCN